MKNDAVDETTETKSEQYPRRREAASFTVLRSTFAVVCAIFAPPIEWVLRCCIRPPASTLFWLNRLNRWIRVTSVP